MLVERWFDPLSGRAGERLRFLEPDGRAEERAFDTRVYTVTELVQLCRAVGLRVEAVYGGPSLEPLDVETRLLLVARKG
jgi:hypothetical protein